MCRENYRTKQKKKKTIEGASGQITSVAQAGFRVKACE